MKDKREILTREIIKQKLIQEAKRSMIGAVLIFALGSLIFGMLHIVVISASRLVPLVVESILFAIFVIAGVFFFMRGVLHVIKARHGEFSVLEDILSDVKDDRFSIWRMFLTGRIFDQSNYEHIFTFASGKKFVANSSEYKNTSLDATAKFSLLGDTFFLVYYNGAPDKIVLLYSSKLYSYKGS